MLCQVFHKKPQYDQQSSDEDQVEMLLHSSSTQANFFPLFKYRPDIIQNVLVHWPSLSESSECHLVTMKGGSIGVSLYAPSFLQIGTGYSNTDKAQVQLSSATAVAINMSLPSMQLAIVRVRMLELGSG